MKWCRWLAVIVGMGLIAQRSAGALVALTSDPPGATILVGGKELGQTPLTLEMPPVPVQITSRFRGLDPVVQTVNPDDGQLVALQFKHVYGSLIVTSDRNDAALTIDGADFGHPPTLVLLSPGNHRVFLTAANAPDNTRQVEVVEGQRASVEIHFTRGSPETTTTSAKPEGSALASPTSTPAPLG